MRPAYKHVILQIAPIECWSAWTLRNTALKTLTNMHITYTQGLLLGHE